MKPIIRTRASNALQGTKYTTQNAPAICALMDYAAQPPGLDFANYGDPLAFRQEARRILMDWKKVRAALHECAQLEVTDAQVIAAAPQAFSGRLQWIKEVHSTATNRIGPEWSYTTGQYWPTEYRKAAFAVLEMAAHNARLLLPKRAMRPTTIAELKVLNRENGGHWFDPGTMASFRSKIESGIHHGSFFISSERFREESPKEYTIRTFDEFGRVNTVSEMGKHKTFRAAISALNAHIKTLNPVTA